MDWKPPPRSGKDPDGPVLVWCAGHRCAALRRLSGGQDHDEQIRATIRQTSGGVLIESRCLGRCELAGVAAVARRDGRSGRIGPLAWFTGLENGTRFAALRRWIASGGPREADIPNQGAPPILEDAACGVTPPPQVRRG
ncbi:hypothetical protein SAMN04488693_12332 [Arthrobacter subterraneus]|uniref:(2Fe-2S) ferredoxin n=1 Tax=Arthrobacter subterraneus TaxID=335973 RepID=A0A1G8NEZ4_9MICC|nr:hypothetical protein [Arthrobacter subterraneus]SDI78831.1 hypothetical protein SAMN04488693_12332 [Arthrobacter subterraneus]